MKHIFTRLATIFLFAIYTLQMQAQGPVPMVTYVWDFEPSHDEYYDQALWLTQSFENELLSHKELYALVERAAIAEVKEHEKLNKELGGEQSLRVRVSNQEALEPGAYFSGNLEYDDGSGEFRLSVKLTSVTGSAQKMRQAETAISKGLINDHNSRKEAVAKLFTKLHAEEQKEAKDFASSWFDNYLFNAKELNTQLRDMESWLPLRSNKSPQVQEQYKAKLMTFVEKITSYNAVIEQLLHDRSEMIGNFCLYWKNDNCKDYGRLLDKLVGFHDRLFNDDSNDIITLINQYNAAPKAKAQKAHLTQILNSRKELLDDFSRDFNDVQYSVRDFEEDMDDALASN